MKDLGHYAALLDDIFGVGTATFNPSSADYNHVVGALANPANFSEFIANFTARLHRLKKIYSSHTDFLKEIKVQANQIADKNNWQGAFAELAAYDHFNQDLLHNKVYLHTPIKPNVSLPKESTFADELGMAEANLDGYVEDRPLYFDVKVFKDNVREILEGIYKEVYRHFQVDDLIIEAEHALDISYDSIKEKRRDLLNELKTAINPVSKTTVVNSKIIPEISFRLLWGKGILTTERTYHPYSHAMNYHRMLFNYTNKFVKLSKTVIVLVTFPWYNGIITDFSNSNVQLYRAMARRVFCQYKHDKTPFKIFNKAYKGSETIFEISQYLSGIVFLEDNSILSRYPDNTNVKSFVYLNPNAKNSMARSLSQDFLMGLHNEDFDNFEFDNY